MVDIETVTSRIARLTALPAFLLIVGWLMLAGILTALVPNGVRFATLNATVAIIYLGWPLLVGRALERSRQTCASLTAKIATANFFVLIVLHVAAGLLLSEPLRGPGWLVALSLIVWGYGLFATFHIFWFGASNLASTDNRAPVAARGSLASCMMFIFLPIGVWFIQRRVRSSLV